MKLSKNNYYIMQHNYLYNINVVEGILLVCTTNTLQAINDYSTLCNRKVIGMIIKQL